MAAGSGSGERTPALQAPPPVSTRSAGVPGVGAASVASSGTCPVAAPLTRRRAAAARALAVAVTAEAPTILRQRERCGLDGSTRRAAADSIDAALGAMLSCRACPACSSCGAAQARARPDCRRAEAPAFRTSGLIWATRGCSPSAALRVRFRALSALPAPRCALLRDMETSQGAAGYAASPGWAR
jgi:hypothetical protein